uniref:Alpha-2,8-sialyltransferase 8b n=1 Tax=Solanum tuberosum TaxID=4113 RepID=M1BRC2_SOLTU
MHQKKKLADHLPKERRAFSQHNPEIWCNEFMLVQFSDYQLVGNCAELAMSWIVLQRIHCSAFYIFLMFNSCVSEV